MRNGVLSHGKHLQNVAPESTLNVVEIDVGKVGALYLFRGVVDEDIDLSVSGLMLGNPLPVT